MCFQNLLLGGPVIVVLEKHSPWKCRLFSPAEDVSLGGGEEMYLNEGRQMFQTLPSVYCWSCWTEWQNVPVQVK